MKDHRAPWIPPNPTSPPASPKWYAKIQGPWVYDYFLHVRADELVGFILPLGQKSLYV